MLSQDGDGGKTLVITYASRTLLSSEKSMCDYTLAKLELLTIE